MILYQYPGGDGLTSISPPCMKVEMALRKLGVEHQVKNLRSLPRVKAISTTERLPVLEADGERIVDSIAILDFLERRFPDADLFPSDAGERVRDRLWEHFANDSMYWCGYYFRWTHPEGNRNFENALFGGQPFYFRWAIGAFFRPRQQKRINLHGHGLKSPEQIEAEMARATDMIVDGIGAGPYLQQRQQPGRGDLACTALLAQAGFANCLPQWVTQLQARPELTAYLSRVLAACSMEQPAWLGTPAPVPAGA